MQHFKKIRNLVFTSLQTGNVIAISLAISALLIWAVGENPLNVAKIFIVGAFGTPYDFGLSVAASIPLIFTGLSIALGLKSKLINIGAEGQLTVAALAAAVAGAFGPADVMLNRALGLTAAAVAGWAWGAVLGYLRAYRQSHEVVAGIMLNYLAYGLCSWLTLQWLRNPASQSPETVPLADTARIAPFEWFQGANIGWQILLPLITIVAFWLIFRWTRIGFNIDASGENPGAASFSGVNARQQIFRTLSWAGLIAGLVGFTEVYGNSGRFIVGFSPGYGFTGIAVALLGRKNPFGVMIAALLFGALYKGSLDLDFETELITREFVIILQAVLVLLISCKFNSIYKWLLPRRWARG
jgi:simple sugar transport system permease protein